MMKKRILRPLVTLGAALLVLLGSTVLPASAATSVSSGANGYKISPVRSDITINKGASQTVSVYVQNVSNAVEDLQVIINDFEASTDESGNPSLLLNGQSAPSHGLKQYITVPTPTFTLQPNEQKEIKVVVSIPTSAAAGGYYGAVRVAPASNNAKNNVTLSASVASLILVTVPGNVKEQMSIAGFDVESGTHSRTILTSGKNLNAVVRFQNSGDVQEEPFGKIILKKNGKQIKEYEVNNTDPRGNVLPNSIRKFSVPLGNIGSFGRYTMQGNFGYGSNGQLLSASTTFYIIPVAFIIILIIIIAIILFLIFELPRLVRRYNRRIASRVSRRQ